MGGMQPGTQQINERKYLSGNCSHLHDAGAEVPATDVVPFLPPAGNHGPGREPVTAFPESRGGALPWLRMATRADLKPSPSKRLRLPTFFAPVSRGRPVRTASP